MDSGAAYREETNSIDCQLVILPVTHDGGGCDVI